MASLETWAVVLAAVPGYAAILGGLYTFLTKGGKKKARKFLGVDNLVEQHDAQAKKLTAVASELHATKAISIAQIQVINSLARLLGDKVEEIDPEDIEVMDTEAAHDALYHESDYSPGDFKRGSSPSDD